MEEIAGKIGLLNKNGDLKDYYEDNAFPKSEFLRTNRVSPFF